MFYVIKLTYVGDDPEIHASPIRYVIRTSAKFKNKDREIKVEYIDSFPKVDHAREFVYERLEYKYMLTYMRINPIYEAWSASDYEVMGKKETAEFINENSFMLMIAMLDSNNFTELLRKMRDMAIEQTGFSINSIYAMDEIFKLADNEHKVHVLHH